MRSGFPARLRGAARALLPENAFLRRDRGAALYITDAPRRGACPDWASAGFIAREANGLVRLTPGPVWLERLEAEYPGPPDRLSESLSRFRGAPDEAALALFALGVRCLEAGDDPTEYEGRLRRRAAVCLREHLPGGGLYACGILRYIIEKERIL